MKRLDLNLASVPIRNRKFFFALLALLVILTLIFVGEGTNIYLTYKSNHREIESNLDRVEKQIREVQRIEKKYSSSIEKLEKENKEIVEMINNLILKKSFPLIGFLTSLEQSLPERSYVFSLAPSVNEGGEVSVRFRVVSESVEDLLRLVDNLKERGFQEIKVLGEERNSEGLILSEITLKY